MKTIFSILLIFLNVAVYAQTFRFYRTENIHNQLRLNTLTGEVLQIQNDGQNFIVHSASTPNNEIPNRYELFQTQNMWTFILLDTFTGRLWQCQFSIRGDDYRASWIINRQILSNTESRKFTIQPLTSMFQFYLINEENGDMWRFQWSTRGSEYRWIERFR